MADDRVIARLGWPRRGSRAETIASRQLAWEGPEFPGLPDDVPWRGKGHGWSPLDTIVLARHRSWQGEHYKFTNSHWEPRGYRLDRVLGSVSRDPQPSTRRLSMLGDAFHLGDGDADAPIDHVQLGHVEQLPFVLLLPISLRRLHATGQHVLVAGEQDPLWGASDHVEHVGWAEGAPIEPLGPVEHTAVWGLRTLVRTMDRPLRRHRYATAPVGADAPGGIRLGGVWSRPAGPARELIALEQTADGRIFSEVLPAGPRRAPAVGEQLRWAAAPLRWAGPRWGPRALAGRIRRLTASAPATVPGVDSGVLGWVRREAAEGCSPLFSAVHPVVGDQLLTRSALEASDLGYDVEGVVGHVADRFADRPPAMVEIPWASRFGHGRRYVEGR